ncbi:MAG: hypothetical protein AAGN82_28710 [Myxococcota bacterium]
MPTRSVSRYPDMLRRAATLALLTLVAAPTTAVAQPSDETEAVHASFTAPALAKSPWALCRILIAERDGAWCRVTKLPFARQGRFHALWELRITDGAFAASRLVVSGPEGVAASYYWWRVNDPEDPGCASITRAMGLERAWLEDGHLVLVSVGRRGTYVEDTPAAPGGYRPMLGRGVFILSWIGDQLRTKDYTPWGGPTYGTKVAPTANGPASWDAIPWRSRRRPEVRDGRLVTPS